MTMSNSDFLLDIFEGTDRGERGIFQQFGIGSDRSREEQRAGQGLFQPIFNNFLGDLAGQIGRGETPTGFRQFLQNNNFNFDRELLQTNTGQSNQSVLGRAGTTFDFGQAASNQFGGR